MRRNILPILLVLVIAVPAFMLGPILWPPAGSTVLQGAQLPLLLIVSALEAIALGVGVLWIIATLRRLSSLPMDIRRPAQVLFVAIGWFLVSWWPHDNMHISNAEDNIWRLIVIEYLFHVSLITAALAAAWSVSRLFAALAHRAPQTAL